MNKKNQRVIKTIVRYDEKSYLETIQKYEKEGYSKDTDHSISLEYPSECSLKYNPKLNPNKLRTVYRVTMSKPRTPTIEKQLLGDYRNEVDYWGKGRNKRKIIRISPEYLEEILFLDYDIFIAGKLDNPTIKKKKISKSLFRTTLGIVDSLIFICDKCSFSFDYYNVLGSTSRYYNNNSNYILKEIRKALRKQREWVNNYKNNGEYSYYTGISP